MDEHTRTQAYAEPPPDRTAVQSDGPPEGSPGDTPEAGYDLRGEIARGGMGVVYRAFDRRFGRDVAVKLVHDHLQHDVGVVHRFFTEARITARLEHPGVPPIHDLGRLPDGRPFLAMKLIHGQTLHHLLAVREAAAVGEWVGVFEKVCQTIAFAHRRGVIHRDLKPANVMVGAFGEVQVMDWGLASGVRSQESGVRREDECRSSDFSPHSSPLTPHFSDETRTQAGTVMGTPAFMPPEQARGDTAAVSARSDVFGLGAMLCVVLTGKPPFGGGGAIETVKLAAAGDVTDALRRLDECGADADLVALARRCLAPRPEDRPADGGEVAAAVAAYRAGVEARLRAVEVERARAAERRKRLRVARGLAAVLVGLLAVMAGGAWWASREAARQRAEEVVREQVARTAIAAGLDQADAAVRAGRIDDADLVLAQVELRAKEFADPGLTDRLNDLRTDIRTVRELDAATDARWLIREKPVPAVPLPPPETDRLGPGAAGRTAAQREADEQQRAFQQAFERAGIVPAAATAVDTGRRIAASRIAGRLVGGLDEWLEMNPEAAGLTAVLAAADPDPLRTAVRAALARRDLKQVRELVAGADGDTFPPSFAAVVGSRTVLPPADSERLLKPAYARHRDSFPLALSLGAASLSYDTADYAEAVGYFRAAIALRPTNLRARMLLMSALGYSGRHAEAIREAAAARDLAPSSPRVVNAVAAAYLLAGRLAEAEAAYRQAVALNPTGQAAYDVQVGLGNLRFERADYRGAVDAYRQAAAALPGDATALAYLGDALEADGQLAAAAQAFRDATAAATPYQSYQHFRLMLALRDRRQFRDAVALLPAVLALPVVVPEEVYPLAIEAAAETGDFARANELAAEQLRKLPRQSPARPRAEALREWTASLLATANQTPAERERVLADPTAAGLLPLFHLADVYRMSSGRTAEADRAYRRLYAGVTRNGFALNAKLLTAMARCGLTGSPTPADRRRAFDQLWAAAVAVEEAHSRAADPTAKLAARKPAVFLLADADFAGVRDADKLGALPAAEQADWRRLWAKVRAVAERSDAVGRETAPAAREQAVDRPSGSR